MKKLILLLMFVILFSSFASAVEDLGTFKQHDCVKLKQLCSNCSYVNITSVIYPNSSEAMGEVVMTKSGTDYNHTFCNSSATGTYIVNGFGDDDGEDQVFAYTFQINPSGEKNFSVLDNSMFLMFMGFGLVILILGLTLSNKWFGFISSVIFILSGVQTMIYGFNGVQNMYTQGFAMTLIGLGFLIMFASAYEFVSWGGEEE